MQRALKTGWIVLLSVAFIILAFLFGKSQGPYFFQTDPEYAYLFNSLNILNGRPPDINQHPGTPMHVLGALIMGVQYLFSWGVQGRPLPLNDSVITQTEQYLAGIHIGVLLLFGFSLIRFFQKLYTATQSLIAILLFWCGLFCFPNIFHQLSRVTPETLMAPVTLLLLTALLPFYFDQKQDPRAEKKIGFILGMGLAVKFTFLPCFLFIRLFQEKSARKTALKFSALGFLIGTLPVLHTYGRMLDWVFKIVTRSGGYGTGKVGIPAPMDVASNFWEYLQSDYFYPIVILAIFIAFQFWKKPARQVHSPLFIGFSVIAIQLFFAMKCLNSRYVYPSYFVAAFLLSTIWVQQKNWIKKNVVALLVGVVCISQLISLNSKAHHPDSAFKSEVIAELEALQKQKPCRVITYYFSPTFETALRFANSWVNRSYRAELMRLYPDFLIYHYQDKIFENYDHTLNDDEIKALADGGKCYYLTGSTRDAAIHMPDLEVEPIKIMQYQSIYKLTGIKSLNLHFAR